MTRVFLSRHRFFAFFLLLAAFGNGGCAYLKNNGLCLATGCVEASFKPAPNVTLPTKPSERVDIYYGKSEVPWRYQELGVISVYGSKEDNGQDAVQEAKNMAVRFGGDGLTLPEAMKGCELPPESRAHCGLQIPLHATLVQRLKN